MEPLGLKVPSCANKNAEDGSFSLKEFARRRVGPAGKGITVYDGLAANDLKTRQLQQRSYDRPPSFSPSEDVNYLLSSSCFLLHFLKFSEYKIVEVV